MRAHWLLALGFGIGLVGCAQQTAKPQATAQAENHPQQRASKPVGPAPRSGMDEMELLPNDGASTRAVSPAPAKPVAPPVVASAPQDASAPVTPPPPAPPAPKPPVNPSAATDAITLLPRYEKGAVDYFETSQTIERELIRGDDATRSAVTQTIGMQREVMEVNNDGSADVRMTFQRFGRIDDTGRAPLDYDTDRDDYGRSSTPLGQALRALIGSQFRVALDREGDLTSQVGLGNVLERATIGADQPTRLALVTELAEDRVSYRWGTAIYALCSPDPVSVGDKWTRVVTQEDQATGSRTNYYYNTLERITEEDGRRLAIIRFTGEIKQDQPGLFTLINGTFEGTAAYDIERGQFVRKSTQAEMRWRLGAAPTEGEDDNAIRVTNRANETVRIMTPDERAAAYKASHGG